MRSHRVALVRATDKDKKQWVEVDGSRATPDWIECPPCHLVTSCRAEDGSGWRWRRWRTQKSFATGKLLKARATESHNTFGSHWSYLDSIRTSHFRAGAHEGPTTAYEGP